MVDAMKNSLLGNRDFLKLWIGQSISQAGVQISLLALPLVAAQSLQATSFQMGALRAAEFLPFILFGLVAGVVSDRMGRRAILITSDFVRALLLVMVPVAFMLGLLQIELLFVVAFLVGSASVFFDVAYWSYLPSLVRREHLVSGNSKLQLSQSTAEALGPAAAGLLVQWLTAPLAIVLNAGSFLLSALSLVMIKQRNVPVEPLPSQVSAWATLGRGLMHVLHDSVLRSLMLRSTLWNFLYNVAMPVLLLYCIQTLSMSATLLGLLFAAMGFGAVVGAMLMSGALARRSVGALIAGSLLVAALGTCGMSLRLGSAAEQTVWLALCLFVIGAASAIYNINCVSLRQAMTPSGLLGQMTAAMLFVSWGIMPFGALLGGYLGERLGYLPTLTLVGIVALLTALTGMWSGPLKQVVALPVAAAD
jgi:MFS family permease